MRPTINDPHLSAKLGKYGSSPDPIKAIWMHQHCCVSESLSWSADKVPSRKGMVNAILSELGHGHWDILSGSFAQIHFEGYPHPAAMQWRAHTGMGTLIQSLRYTGERFKNESDIDVLFYNAGSATQYYRDAVSAYNTAVEDRWKKEDARNLLPSAYRQGWDSAGSLKQWLHVLERRMLGDTQLEARHAAWAAFDELREWCPEIMDWWLESRGTKNKLAP
jgi:flavin-dependent thymidylate synthase